MEEPQRRGKFLDLKADVVETLAPFLNKFDHWVLRADSLHELDPTPPKLEECHLHTLIGKRLDVTTTLPQKRFE